MTPKTRRRALTAASLLWFAVVGFCTGHIPLKVLNVLLVLSAVPMVWLLWAFCRWSAHQHAEKWARDIAKVHGGRPLPHQAVSR